MRIAGGDVMFSSETHSNQLNLTRKSTAQKKIVRQRYGTKQIKPDVPRVIVDRVRLYREQRAAFQTGYCAKIKSASMVTSHQNGESVLHEQTAVVEKLVGGIIDKKAVIRNMSSSSSVSSVQEVSLKRTDIHFESEMANFSARGSVFTVDGRSIDFSLDLSLNRTFLSRTEEETLVQQWQERVDLTDPLIISLDGCMPELSDAVFAFDFNGDGRRENVSFASAGAGFLALDQNGDGIINDGTELFGPQTGNGFEELRTFDNDRNGWIDENDDVFSQLVVWTKDETGSDRLITLKEAGIGAIGLGNAATLMDVTALDNTLKGRLKSTGIFLFENGKAGTIHQVDLAEREIQETGPAQSPVGSRNASAAMPGEGRVQAELFHPASSESANALKDLQERIKVLKEEMKQLLENSGHCMNRKNSKIMR